MFRDINELLTFLSIMLVIAITIFYFIRIIFSINKENFSLSKMYLYFYNNEDE